MTVTGYLIDYLTPIMAATVASGLIGLERELRAHPAGLRTHILVGMSSALVMLGAVHQASWIPVDIPRDMIRFDPARMAHGVLTGVGFLCGGVIFRQGLTVHGLTSAASLWGVAALGLLYGAQAYDLALTGTVITLIVLVLLRWVDERLPRDRVVEVSVAYRRGDGSAHAAFTALLAEMGLQPGRMNHALSDDATEEIGGRLRLRKGMRGQAVAERLLADPRVVRFQITPRND